MFERKHEKVVPTSVFAKRMLGAVGLAIGLILPALFIGIAGYHWIDQLDWVDSLLEASMILGGMGPINPPTTTNAKLFASVYALFSGIIFIALMGLLLTPLVHRLMHKFHVKDSG